MKKNSRESLYLAAFTQFLLFFFAISALFADEGSDKATNKAANKIAGETASKTLRVASYNIRICRGVGPSQYQAEDEQDIDRTVEALKRLDFDVIGLQEVDRKTDRCRGVDQIAVLAEKTGCFATYGKAIDLPGGEYGIGILSKEKPLSVKNVPLPGKEERRTLLIAEFDDFVFFNAHFSLTAESRAESAQIVQAQLAQQSKPVIFVGDMNVASDDERARLFGEHWTVLTPDQPTFPADKPRVRLDYIQIADPSGQIPVNDPSWTARVVDSGVADEPAASDHRPVFVEFKGK